MTVIDLFAGPGGWDIAARKLGLEPVGIEMDRTTCDIRDAYGLRTICGDVYGLDPTSIAEDVTGLIASPPCEQWSSAGKQEARGDIGLASQLVATYLAAPRECWDEARSVALFSGAPLGAILAAEPARWIAELDPGWVAMEQVPAVLPLWDVYASYLQAAGYMTWHGILDAAKYGVPQERRRAVLIASTLREPMAPAPLAHPIPAATVLGRGRVGFARKNDRPDGGTHRARDMRSTELPCFTVTSKVRSWSIVPEGSETARQLTVPEVEALMTFPPSGVAMSRSAHMERLALAVPPRLAYSILQEAVAS